MNDDARLIKAALERRFARASVPACPEVAWRAATTEPVTITRRRGVSRGFAYAAGLVAVVAIAGLAAQASSTIHGTYTRIMSPFFVSSKPLQPGIHRADRLTIAQAQSRMPFTIVVPTGLPAHTRFVYAHILSEKPTPRVALTYEAHVASKYYRISFDESTVAVGPPRARFEWQSRDRGIQTWTIPMRRFKHGDIVMDMFAWGLPSDLSDQIVRANTM